MRCKKIAVTGGAGQIAYSLLFRIANGDLLGKNQPVQLHILEVPQGLNALKGVVMELNDCTFPLLEKITISSDPYVGFDGVDLAILVGAKPRGVNMERKDLLLENSKIFIEQGRALNEVAKKDVKVLVIGNPCNTNCLIAMHNAPDLSRKNFFAMTRLDQNRASYQLAQRANVSHKEVSNLIIWGNHSATQVPDYFHATIQGQPAQDIIADTTWLQTGFIETVQKRGSEIIQARGKSSAASAANAIIDTIQSLIHQTMIGESYSLGVYAKDNPYGIDPDLIFSFPCMTDEMGKWSISPNYRWNSWLEKQIKASEKELKEERDMIAKIL